mmetsp:Transcript_61789/g.143773  ORF Transcript_61789/g.143773 Transcript_61789/m.143773 type:complete len:217 (-) Transcript_61789:88-738(-)
MEDIDGRWPEPLRAPAVHHRKLRTASFPRKKDLKQSEPKPVCVWGHVVDKGKPPSRGPFYDLDRAGGFKMSLSNSVEYLDQRYAAMRPYSAPRFYRRQDEAGPGPGTYVQKQWPSTKIRPSTSSSSPSTSTSTFASTSASTEHFSSVLDDLSSSEGSAVFKSGQPRVPTNSTSWLLLRNRTAEVSSDILSVDERCRHRHADGRMKGAFFKGSSRFV